MQAKGGEDMGTAYNRAYLASVLRTFAQILLRRTSDTRQLLGEISEEVVFKWNVESLNIE